MVNSLEVWRVLNTLLGHIVDSILWLWQVTRYVQFWCTASTLWGRTLGQLRLSRPAMGGKWAPPPFKSRSAVSAFFKDFEQHIPSWGMGWLLIHWDFLNVCLFWGSLCFEPLYLTFFEMSSVLNCAQKINLVNTEMPLAFTKDVAWNLQGWGDAAEDQPLWDFCLLYVKKRVRQSFSNPHAGKCVCVFFPLVKWHFCCSLQTVLVRNKGSSQASKLEWHQLILESLNKF